MKIEAIMVSDVYTVTLDMTVRQAIALITSKKVSGAPVVDKSGTVISVISEGNLLRLSAAGKLEAPVSACLDSLPKTDELITLNRNQTFADAYKLFLKHSVHRLVITDANGRLQGIVSRSNLLKLLTAPQAEAEAIPGVALKKAD